MILQVIISKLKLTAHLMSQKKCPLLKKIRRTQSWLKRLALIQRTPLTLKKMITEDIRTLWNIRRTLMIGKGGKKCCLNMNRK
jgi:hypothetical protein